MFKVYKVDGGWEVFWLPSWPMTDQDKIPHDGKVYSEKSAAYRKLAKLKRALEQQEAKKKMHEAVA